MDAALILEGFNVTNRKNPRLIDSSYVAGAPSATFGNILVPLPGRELQLGARLKFRRLVRTLRNSDRRSVAWIRNNVLAHNS